MLLFPKRSLGLERGCTSTMRPQQTHDYRTPRQVYEAQYRWVCGRSASPTGCAFDHIPTGTTISKGFNNDGLNGIMPVTAPP